MGPSVPRVGNASRVYVREEFKSWKIHSWDFLDAAEQVTAENSAYCLFVAALVNGDVCILE